MTGKEIAGFRISPRAAVIILAVVVLLGFCVRAHGLTKYSFWFDEYFHAFAAKGILESGRPVLPSGELYNRGAAYSGLVAVSFRLFGSNEVAARLPSLMLGLLTILLVYYVAARFFSRRVGLISAFLYALSPFCILWSQMCRLYSLFQPVYLLMVFFFFKALEERNRIKYFLLFCVFFLFSAHVHEFTVLFIPAVFAYCLIMLCVKITQQGVAGVLRLRYFWISLIIGAAALVVLFLKKGSVLESLSGSPVWAEDVAGDYNFYREMISKMYPVAAYLFPLAILALITRKPKQGLFVSVGFIMPFMILSIITWKAYRYMFFIWPFFLIITAGLLDYGVDAVLLLRQKLLRLTGRLAGRKPVKEGVTAVVFLLALYPVMMPWIKVAPHTYRRFDVYNFSQGAAVIRQIPDEDIIISTESLLLEFYTGRKPDYIVHIYEYSDNKLKKSYVMYDDLGRQLDKRSGVLLLKDVKQLQEIEQQGKKVWIVANRHFLLPGLKQRRLDLALAEYITGTYTRYRHIDDVVEIYHK